MTDEDRQTALKLLEGFEKELPEVIKGMGTGRELSIASTKLDEFAMWLRRAIERS